MNRREFLKTLAGALGVGAVASLLAQKNEPEVFPYRGCYFVPAFDDAFSTRSWIVEKMEYMTLGWENKYRTMLWGEK